MAMHSYLWMLPAVDLLTSASRLTQGFNWVEVRWTSKSGVAKAQHHRYQQEPLFRSLRLTHESIQHVLLCTAQRLNFSTGQQHSNGYCTL
ncbi:hypothetical protein J3F84DRAFT_356778 [Trichoderma pleuroticola]